MGPPCRDRLRSIEGSLTFGEGSEQGKEKKETERVAAFPSRRCAFTFPSDLINEGALSRQL